MSLNAAALALMQQKGLSLSDVVEIATAIETRSKAAERQAKYRRAKKARDVTNDDVTRDVTPPPLNEVSNPPDSPQDIPDGISPPAVLKPDHVLEAWNAMADRTGVPKAKLTPERRKKLAPFIRRHSVDDITEAIGAVERSPFLRGENDRCWKADFNWMLEPRNFTKLTEGTYDR